MSGLEVALIILVTIWSVIFLIIGIALLLVFLAVRKAINKANQILERTEEVANKVDLPSKVVIASIVAFVAKNSYGGLKSLIADNFFKKRK
jgi:membrane-anchored glycerophosphoryl diester phosphodiesterase (GDPDase)